MNREYHGPCEIDCAHSCHVPEGATLVEVPRPRHNWSDIIHCPHGGDGCERSFLVIKGRKGHLRPINGTIAQVVLWSNGMVTVFGDDGVQLPAYQGRFADVRDMILRDAPATTKFKIGHYPDVMDASRECFASEGWHPKEPNDGRDRDHTG